MTNADLDELLSRPNEADIAAVHEFGGDLVILGVGGKMGPTLAMRARRAADKAGVKMRVIGVSRFSSNTAKHALEKAGIEVVTADLLDRDAVASLPDVPNVLFMTGRKFGSTGGEALTWAMNAYVPALVAERYSHSRIVSFSTGNIYPYVPISSGGATEQTPPAPVGEYGISALGRERMFEYFSIAKGTRVAILRLNYAIDLRYGVLLDIGTKVAKGEAVDVSMGAVRFSVKAGDANSIALRSFAHASSPAFTLNLTGPETLSVRWIAHCFADALGVEPVFKGHESTDALLNNAAQCMKLFGYPTVSPEKMIEMTAKWIEQGGATLGKPTHFDARDGKF